MKKRLSTLAALIIVATMIGCNQTTPVEPVVVVKPTLGLLELNFRAMYANKPLIINKIYDYNGKKVKFERLQFFIAYNEISFDSAVGDNPPKTTLVKLTGLEDSTAAAAGVTTAVSLASKSWASVNFAIGVPKTKNAAQPKDFLFPDGLADGINFWDSWQSYIFVKLEGKIDGNGDGVPESGITLHTGGNDVYTPLKFAKTFIVEDNKTTQIKFELSIEELIKNIDLATVNSTHQIGASPIMKIMMGNLATALTVK